MVVHVDIKTTLRRTPPSVRRLQFAAIKKVVLGDRYELSLVICGDDLARKINKQYRKKMYAANVLSFPLEKNAGEIFLNVRAAQRESKKYHTTFEKRLALLFIHGCYHLKGLEHSDKMEQLEQKILREFGY